MDMSIFHVESNKTFPVHAGNILIASPLLPDYRFARTVILLVAHDSEGSVGLVVNKRFYTTYTLNMIVPELKYGPQVPVYPGGPMDKDNLFFIHSLSFLDGAVPLGHGLYVNGDFEFIKDYIMAGNPVEGRIRFFTGYAGWTYGQLEQEIEENSWIIGNSNPMTFLRGQIKHHCWKNCLENMGSPYNIWATYPQFPSLN